MILAAIADELAIDLREAFPNLAIDRNHDYILVNFNSRFNSGIIIWVRSESIGITMWKKDLAIDTAHYPYCDPEVFDRIQSFISAHYTYLLQGCSGVRPDSR